MNPPFTRDSLRHDQFSRADELVIKRREKTVMQNLPDRAACALVWLRQLFHGARGKDDS